MMVNYDYAHYKFGKELTVPEAKNLQYALIELLNYEPVLDQNEKEGDGKYFDT